jgi:hypothetical protein
MRVFFLYHQLKKLKRKKIKESLRAVRKTKSTPNDLEQIKNFLQTLKGELLNITIVSHSKKKNSYQQAHCYNFL